MNPITANVRTSRFCYMIEVVGAYDIHSGDDLYGRLQMLQAGDEVIVHAGTYTTPGFLRSRGPAPPASRS